MTVNLTIRASNGATTGLALANPVVNAPSTGWPDATNTGVPAGTVLTNSGGITTTANGQIIDAKNIAGWVLVNHNNVTIKRCKITGGDYYQILVSPNKTGCIVQDCDIDNTGAGGQGIAGQGTFLRNNIVHCSDGIDVRGDNTVIQDNYIHNMTGSSDSHFDGIQADGGFKNLTIRHNTIINENGQTSGIMLDNYWGPIDNVLIENNIIMGGGYTVYLQEANAMTSKVTNVRFLNNRLKRGYYGYLNIGSNAGFVPVLSGNVDYATGQPVSG